MFRNVAFIHIASAWPQSEEDIDAALIESRFEPCGALNERSFGWESPAGEYYPRLCRSVAGADLLQLRTQSRLLPAAAVNEALEVRLAEYRERMGEPPGRRERRRLKADTRDKLLPKALLRSERTKGLYLGSEKILAIDAATPAKVERFVEMLRTAFGRLEASELTFKTPVGGLLRRMFLGDVPGGISIGRECRMQDPVDVRASVRFADMDLADANIRRHVRDGMELTHLGLEFDSVMSCVLDDKGRLSKLRLAGVEAEDTGVDEDPLARLDADIVLLAEILRRFLSVLTQALGKV
jgi:recombination associated protein RdgC